MTQPPTFHPLDPPPRKAPNRRAVVIIISACVIGVVAIAVLGWWMLRNGDFTQQADKTFGDQHLKTTVALIELHKVRYGQYPEDLGELKFLGPWDRTHVNGCNYVPADDRQSYFVEVDRGWMNKPVELDLPEEFWQNTGYDPTLRPEE
jgi:hypothetical protein